MSRATDFLQRMLELEKINRMDAEESHDEADRELVQFIHDLAANHPEREEILKALAIYERMERWVA